MGTNLNSILLIDCEATCWATKEEQGSKPNEIIEIGACELLLRTGEIHNRLSIVVKPRRTKVSEFCTELTGWTQQAVDQEGLDIEEALREVARSFKCANSIWGSYGEYDRNKLSSLGRGGVGELYRIPIEVNPFDAFRAHWNVKTLFAVKQKLQREVGLSKALELIKEPLEGRHHNGADDAYNIAKVLRSIFN